MAPMRTYALRWSSKFTHIYKNVLSPSSIFMKFVSDHSLYEKSAVHACVGLLCVSTSSDQVQNLHAALTSCYLHLLFSWSFSNITSSMRNQPCMQVLGFCAWVHTPIKFFQMGHTWYGPSQEVRRLSCVLCLVSVSDAQWINQLNTLTLIKMSWFISSQILSHW